MPLVAALLLAQSLQSAHELDGLDADIKVEASEVRVIETTLEETVIRGRPWSPQKRVGTVDRGTRLLVRGTVKSRMVGNKVDKQGCKGKDWYAVWPLGYVCSLEVSPSTRGIAAQAALPLSPGRRLPFSYAYVALDATPIYASAEKVREGSSSGTLGKDMSIVITGSVEIDDKSYLQLQNGTLIAKDDIRWAGEGSKWSGVTIVARAPQHDDGGGDVDGDQSDVWTGDLATYVGPGFAWTSQAKVVVRSAPSITGEKLELLALRTRVPLLEREVDAQGQVWWRVGEGRYILADLLNEVHYTAPPRSIGKDPERQWIDVDVGEQVLVAYRGAAPVFATLVSTGRGNGTPLGDYPIWAKVASLDMSNQGYEDNEYLVEGVPWVLLFQGHNALHGAYWHDRFGHKKSHGCVNLSPMDARFIFEWVTPILLGGWTGYLPPDLQRSVLVHIRDSSRPEGMEFTQERRIGPPDFAAEAKLTEEAMARRGLLPDGSDPGAGVPAMDMGDGEASNGRIELPPP